MDANPPVVAEPAVPAIDPQIRTVLLCDLADSTALVERIGDRAAACLMQQHDRLVRQLLREHGGQEIDKSDGFLALFDHPSHAVDFALDYQRDLRALGNAEGCDLRARVGIHVGDVLTWRSADADISRGAKPVNVEGLAKPVAARLMQLAEPGQTLLSGVAFSLAVRAGNPALHAGARWCGHGRYRFKGVPEPVQVHEVGEPGIAPLRAPPSADKAWRDVPLWRRPAVLAAQAAGLLAVAAIVWMTLLRATPEAVAFRERDWVVVGSLNNLTGDPRFDGALETALRISLEQSRHVNVLPDLRVRDTLQRMGRAPDSPVDRATASEIALREGARAVLLPTVAEIGGRVRVSLEVVDPNNQKTVYAESADGAGAESALASVGDISERLRSKLGETVKSIEQSSEPVARVTSSSLDALRAYTLATRAFAVAELDEARAHLEHALALDPEFALAHAGVARYHIARAQHEQALQSLRHAASKGHRLSAREKLQVGALLAMVGHQQDYPEKLKALADMYPDEYPAAHNYALTMWYANDFAKGLTYAVRATGPQSVTRPASIYLQGILALGLDELDEASAHFHEGRSLGLSPAQTLMVSAVHAAKGDFAPALKELAGTSTRNAGEDLERRLLELVFMIDQGRWSDARQLADDVHDRAVALPEGPLRWKALGTHLIGYRFGKESAVRANAVFSEVLSSLRSSTAIDRERASSVLLYCGYIAADEGNIKLARRAIDAVSEIAEASPLHVLANLIRMVEAHIANMEGRHADALALLDPVIDGNEPVLAHRVAADAHYGLGNDEEARREALWLVEHRGRGYAEHGGSFVFRGENILQSRLALLRAAEAAARVGNIREAKQHLDGFRDAWPDSGSHESVRLRVTRLESKFSLQQP